MGTPTVRRLDANHDIQFGRGFQDIATKAESTAQRVVSRLLVIKGEWFLDTDAGVPWWQPSDSLVQPIMGGRRDLAYAESLIKKSVLETEGVASITSFFMNFDGSNRSLTVSLKGTTVDGDIFNISQFKV